MNTRNTDIPEALYPETAQFCGYGSFFGDGQIRGAGTDDTNDTCITSRLRRWNITKAG